jgi:hypothetical protein
LYVTIPDYKRKKRKWSRTFNELQEEVITANAKLYRTSCKIGSMAK